MGLGKKIKRGIVSGLALHLTAKGFTEGEARRWVRSVYRQYFRQSAYGIKEVHWAVRRGFMPEQIENLGLTEKNYNDTISAKEYAFLRPLNGTYGKWISDKVTIHAIFKPYRKIMPECYYQIYRRDDEVRVIPLFDPDAEDTMEAVLKLLQDKKQLRARVSNRKKSYALSYARDTFYFNGQSVSQCDMKKILSSFPFVLVITEDVVPVSCFDKAVLHLVVFHEHGQSPVIGESTLSFHDHRYYAQVDRKTGRITPLSKTIETLPETIPFWEQILKTVNDICDFTPQLEYFGIDIVLTQDGFKIMEMVNHPPYPECTPFSRETSAYLKQKVEQKRQAYSHISVNLQRAGKKMKLKFRAAYSKLFFPKGLLPYLSVRWFSELKRDFLTNRDTTLKQKIWAARHGFLSYRLPQYGITKENYTKFISDFEYKWLRHINNKYRHWLEDKITVKYICSAYNHCFPQYYYHVSMRNGDNRIISMMDCPEGYGNTYEDIRRLIEEKGVLALKPDEGSHGDGFYKLSYEQGRYYLNHQESRWQDVLHILQDVKNQYLITEYIDMHKDIKAIYDGAVNTIRMIVFKKDGKTPRIGNAYMRFGSKRTGAVDNMGAGGMFAKVDIDTGRFYDAKIIEDNQIRPCLYHPDTGVKIEGYLPHWEQTKQEVLAVAGSIPQLEFFGFDLALTEEGLKFPEINRFPDYPAIEKYTPETIDYLLYKLEKKKKKYGYDSSRGHKLVKLPKR